MTKNFEVLGTLREDLVREPRVRLHQITCLTRLSSNQLFTMTYHWLPTSSHPSRTFPSRQSSSSFPRSYRSSPDYYSTPFSTPSSTPFAPVRPHYAPAGSQRSISQVINRHLIKSCALLAYPDTSAALFEAETALQIAEDERIYHLISKCQLYRGLCFMEMRYWAEASGCFTRAANVKSFAGRVSDLKRDCEWRLDEQRKREREEEWRLYKERSSNRFDKRSRRRY